MGPPLQSAVIAIVGFRRTHVKTEGGHVVTGAYVAAA